jgi:hypothetical protein
MQQVDIQPHLAIASAAYCVWYLLLTFALRCSKQQECENVNGIDMESLVSGLPNSAASTNTTAQKTLQR